MIRARFYVPSEDYRPVEWPIKHPYWCSGHRGSDDAAVLVAYADDEAEILRLWPDAEDIDAEEVSAHQFSNRFPCPEWFSPEATP